MTTAAKSPCCNGACEQLNAVIQNSVHRIMVDCKCDEEVALVWTIAAINSITNNIGFSPNKLVFEYNPTLLNVFENAPPLRTGTNDSIVFKTCEGQLASN